MAPVCAFIRPSVYRHIALPRKFNLRRSCPAIDVLVSSCFQLYFSYISNSTRYHDFFSSFRARRISRLPFRCTRSLIQTDAEDKIRNLTGILREPRARIAARRRQLEVVTSGNFIPRDSFNAQPRPVHATSLPGKRHYYYRPSVRSFRFVAPIPQHQLLITHYHGGLCRNVRRLNSASRGRRFGLSASPPPEKCSIPRCLSSVSNEFS